MKLSNRQIVIMLGGCVGLMVALAYASVPLYTLFCRATGFGGTTQRAVAAIAPVRPDAKNRTFTVSFDGNVDSALPWDFAPVTRTITIKLGETAHILYRAHNRGDHTVTGSATYNVQPDKAGLYFTKIQCFCFTRQTLKPGESADLPVEFYLDPGLADDPNAADITHLTLSYTFYSAKNPAKSKGDKQASLPLNPAAEKTP